MRRENAGRTTLQEGQEALAARDLGDIARLTVSVVKKVSKISTHFRGSQHEHQAPGDLAFHSVCRFFTPG